MLTYPSKRCLLKSGVALPLVWSATHPVFAQSKAVLDMRILIQDLLDVLIPKDETPSATGAGVHEKIWIEAQKVNNYAAMLHEGASWMDQQAKGMGVSSGYIGLSNAQKNQLIVVALAAPPTALPRVFMMRLMEDAFRFYYSRKVAYRMIKSLEPIQPVGYPQQNKAPSS